MSARRILLIDDDEGTLTFLRGLLEAEGLPVVAVGHNAKEAYRLYLEHRPQVLVMDLMLPGEGGLDIAAQVLEVDPDVAVVLYSAFIDDAVRRRAEAIGVACCVSKDEPEVLVAEVRQRCGPR